MVSTIGKPGLAVFNFKTVSAEGLRFEKSLSADAIIQKRLKKILMAGISRFREKIRSVWREESSGKRLQFMTELHCANEAMIDEINAAYKN